MQPGLGQKPGLVIETDLLPGAVHGQAFHRIFICSLVRKLDERILVYSNANKSTLSKSPTGTLAAREPAMSPAAPDSKRIDSA